MKRLVKIIILTFGLMFCITVNVFAVEENIDRYKDEFSFDEVVESLDDETVRILNEIGIDEISFEKIFSVSPQKVFNALFDLAKNAFVNPLKFLATACTVIMLTFLLSSFSQWKETVDLIGGAILSLSVAVPFAEVINTAFSVLDTLNIFTTAFSGVFCAVTSAAGLVSSGVSYTALSVFSNTLFSQVLSQISQPLINGVCALGFLSSFDSFGFSSGVSSVIKKIYVFMLSFIGTLFSGIVTLRGALSGNADNLTAKSVRFVVGRSLPVVGGAVSETYSSLVGSLSLLKNTVGVFGIISVVIIVLPCGLSLIGWFAAFEVLITFCSMFGNTGISKMLCIFKDVTVLLIATVSITATIMVVSVGVVIAMKNNL